MAMNNYRFLFSGQLASEAAADAVAEKLAALFKVTAEEVMPLVSGESRFERDKLNRFTAEAYLALFRRAGAIGEVSQEPVHDDLAKRDSIDRLPCSTESAGNPASAKQGAQSSAAQPGESIVEQAAQLAKDCGCPKCGSSNVDAEQCFSCGIFIEKYRQAQAARALNTELIEPAAQDSDSARKALRWIQSAATLLLVIFIADGFLQETRAIPNLIGIDLGYLPYIVAHLILLRGCLLYAEAKGYSPWLGLLAMGSLAGLAVLVMLPDRYALHYRRTTKQLAGAIFCVALSLYWLAGFSGNQQLQSDTAAAAELLVLGRSNYPLEQLDSEEQLYASEQQELLGFVRESLQGIQREKLRPQQISRVADIIFMEVFRYQVWRNYQTYLHYQQGRELPIALQPEARRANERLFAELFAELITEESPPRLQQAYTDWTYGDNPETTAALWPRISQHLNDVTRLYMNEYHMRAGRAAMNEEALDTRIDLSRLAIGTLGKVDVRANGQFISYSAPLGPLAQSPLVVVFYLQPLTRQGVSGPQQSYLVTRSLVSADFPGKYLYGDFNPLKNYLRIP